MSDISNEPPKPDTGDAAHTLGRALLSMIPIVGGPAIELFSTIIVPPLSKRRDEWVVSIVRGLRDLEEKVEGFTIESLAQNQAFITLTMHASQAAIRNHQQDKLNALRNAVLNAALPNAPDEDLQLMFIRLIDQNTTWHLRILKLYEDPWDWGQKHRIEYPVSSEKVHLIEYHFPELVGRHEFYKQICNDLYAQGLTTVAAGTFIISAGTSDSRTAQQKLHDHLSPRISLIGKQFLSFIENPIEDNADQD